MKTYQDLLDCGQDDRRRIEFVRSAVREHKNSSVYEIAVSAGLYYSGENPTINVYEKVIYDIKGKAHKDMYTANHKIASRFFGFVVDQEVSYLLGQGITFSDPDTLQKLGPGFYKKVCAAATAAKNGGCAFGFWDFDHLEVFEITEFVPLYDEDNGALMAGIRFWQVADNKPLRCTLYELDGFTEYIQTSRDAKSAFYGQKKIGGTNGEMVVLQAKRAYKLHVTGSPKDETKIYEGENYPAFPIVPLKNNRFCKSELSGRRSTIDALDLCCSNMVNNVDEGNIIYWILTNCGGMDYADAEKFLNAVKKSHVAFMDNADDGARAEPHTIEAPYVGTQTAIDMLEKKLYQDFQAFDASAVQAGNQTATAIRASYIPLDLKTDKFENQVTEFIEGILTLAGMDDQPTYTRNQIINKQEEIQSILLTAPYVTREYLTKKLLTILGDADMVDDILKELEAEDLRKFESVADDSEDEDGSTGTPTADEAIDAAEEAVGKTLNGSQTSSLITVIKGLKSGDITEGQAVRILTTSIGVTREEAMAIIRGEE